MKSSERNLCLVLICAVMVNGLPSYQALCLPQDACSDKFYGQQNYCPTTIISGELRLNKHVCESFEVILGNLNFYDIYLHCCMAGYSSLTWVFRPDNTSSWRSPVFLGDNLHLQNSNQTIHIRQPDHRQIGYYKCTAKNGTSYSISKMVQIKALDCLDFHQTEVWLEKSKLVTKGQDVEILYRVHFPCDTDVVSRGVKFYFDGKPIKQGSNIGIKGTCASDSCLPRVCNGSITIQKVTEEQISKNVSVAAFNRSAVQEMKNCTLINATPVYISRPAVTLEVILGISLSVVFVCVIIIITAVLRRKISSKMTFLNKDESRRHVYILHDEEGRQTAGKVELWLKTDYGIHVILSGHLSGEGTTEEMTKIKKSAHVFVLPPAKDGRSLKSDGKSPSEENNFENIFNCVASIDSYRVTILDTERPVCSTLKKKRSFKYLKHIELHFDTEGKISKSVKKKLRKRLPSYITSDKKKNAYESISTLDSTSGYQCSGSPTSDIRENGLYLMLPTVSSQRSVDLVSPDTASTLLSLDPQSSIPDLLSSCQVQLDE